MLKNNIFILCLILSIQVSFSQVTINSPYSRYGVGNLIPQTNAINTGMGGLSNSYASTRNINTTNPALLTRLSKTTFEIGLGLSYLQTIESGKTNNTRDFGFDYLNAAFPLHRRYTLGVGLRPYSQLNYNNESITTLDSDTDIKDTYKGEGGITSTHLTNSFAILKDSIRNSNLSLGIDVAYLSGNTTKSNQSLLLINGTENNSYSSVVNTSVYRGFKFNVGASYRKELFVGNDFETIKKPKCLNAKGEPITREAPKFIYQERIAERAQKSIQQKYVIIYPGSSQIKISKDIKNGERRELLNEYYSSIVKKGFGVLVLNTAEGISYADLKSDYLEAYYLIKDELPVFQTYEKANEYSKEYLEYGSGVFFNLGFNYEHNNDLNVSGSKEITRFNTYTTDPYDNSYSLSEFDNQQIQLPSVYRFGISLDKPQPSGRNICNEKRKSTWLTGVDLSVFNWSNTSIYSSSLTSPTTFKINVGGQITPNPENIRNNTASRANQFLNKLDYRAGFYYQTLPYSHNSKQVSEVGINFGLTIPANNNGSLLTWTFGFATRGSDLQENYIKTGLGLTLNENQWFEKRRIGL